MGKCDEAEKEFLRAGKAYARCAPLRGRTSSARSLEPYLKALEPSHRVPGP